MPPTHLHTAALSGKLASVLETLYAERGESVHCTVEYVRVHVLSQSARAESGVHPSTEIPSERNLQLLVFYVYHVE